MSRSIKKPWVKDPANSYMKRIHARKMRRITKSIINKFIENWQYSNGPEIPHYRSVTNQYDVCDYKFFCEEKKYTRK